MRRAMDYVFTVDNEEVLIEGLQKDTRSRVIAEYSMCRKGKKMTQEKLARLSGISRPNITRFESGYYNPSLEMLVRIAAAMDMEIKLELVPRETPVTGA
ncbi:MAG: helix-turn-helix domain-containing protein [Roseburia sp.]|nr:helix-turn-helix domain-containing protein [Roseburia sp.]MCM1096709.1 helix-turn-helix domain-containing protein [Ruminococcus flavefaciens]